ncbi:MAG: peptide deformylase [Rickettsiales bacterium]|nr:peptide deformylase [Rickettsiales bacterium]
MGLAAPQVHINKRIFVYQNPDTVTNESNIKITALINPKIEKVSEQINDSWEGCLSIPGMLGLVRRFTKIEYSGYDIKGNKIMSSAEGLHSRIIQHENDHLNGILYTKRLAHKDAFGFENEIEKYWKQNEKSKN